MYSKDFKIIVNVAFVCKGRGVESQYLNYSASFTTAKCVVYTTVYIVQ